MRNISLAASLLSSVCRQPLMPSRPRSRRSRSSRAAASGAWRTCMRDMPGIVSIEVGYAGGKSTHVWYHDVSPGSTGHAEVGPHRVRPERRYRTRTSCCAILPRSTTRRSSIARTTTSARSTARRSSRRPTSRPRSPRRSRRGSTTSGKWKKPIVTKIEPATTLVRAEDYHQDYLVKHPERLQRPLDPSVHVPERDLLKACWFAA